MTADTPHPTPTTLAEPTHQLVPLDSEGKRWRCPDCEANGYVPSVFEHQKQAEARDATGLRERLEAVVRKWSGHLSERMLDDLERAALATEPQEPRTHPKRVGHRDCPECYLDAALREGAERP